MKKICATSNEVSTTENEVRRARRRNQLAHIFSFTLRTSTRSVKVVKGVPAFSEVLHQVLSDVSKDKRRIRRRHVHGGDVEHPEQEGGRSGRGVSSHFTSCASPSSPLAGGEGALEADAVLGAVSARMRATARPKLSADVDAAPVITGTGTVGRAEKKAIMSCAV